MTDQEVLAAVAGNTLLARVRREVFGAAESINQAMQQRNPPAPVQVRRLELGAARDVIGLVREPDLALLKDIRKALDSGYLFVTRGEGRDSACALLDRLNEAVGDTRSDAVRVATKKGGAE